MNTIKCVSFNTSADFMCKKNPIFFHCFSMGWNLMLLAIASKHLEIASFERGFLKCTCYLLTMHYDCHCNWRRKDVAVVLMQAVVLMCLCLFRCATLSEADGALVGQVTCSYIMFFAWVTQFPFINRTVQVYELAWDVWFQDASSFCLSFARTPLQSTHCGWSISFLTWQVETYHILSESADTKWKALSYSPWFYVGLCHPMLM